MSSSSLTSSLAACTIASTSSSNTATAAPITPPRSHHKKLERHSRKKVVFAGAATSEPGAASFPVMVAPLSPSRGGRGGGGGGRCCISCGQYRPKAEFPAARPTGGGSNRIAMECRDCGGVGSMSSSSCSGRVVNGVAGGALSSGLGILQQLYGGAGDNNNEGTDKPEFLPCEGEIV